MYVRCCGAGRAQVHTHRGAHMGVQCRCLEPHLLHPHPPLLSLPLSPHSPPSCCPLSIPPRHGAGVLTEHRCTHPLSCMQSSMQVAHHLRTSWRCPTTSGTPRGSARASHGRRCLRSPDHRCPSTCHYGSGRSRRLTLVNSWVRMPRRAYSMLRLSQSPTLGNRPEITGSRLTMARLAKQ